MIEHAESFTIDAGVKKKRERNTAMVTKRRWPRQKGNAQLDVVHLELMLIYYLDLKKRAHS
jgi:hypothetical protein